MEGDIRCCGMLWSGLESEPGMAEPDSMCSILMKSGCVGAPLCEMRDIVDVLSRTAIALVGLSRVFHMYFWWRARVCMRVSVVRSCDVYVLLRVFVVVLFPHCVVCDPWP